MRERDSKPAVPLKIPQSLFIEEKVKSTQFHIPSKINNKEFPFTWIPNSQIESCTPYQIDEGDFMLVFVSDWYFYECASEELKSFRDKSQEPPTLFDNIEDVGELDGVF